MVAMNLSVHCAAFGSAQNSMQNHTAQQCHQNSTRQHLEDRALESLAQTETDANAQRHAGEQEAILVLIVAEVVMDRSGRNRECDGRDGGMSSARGWNGRAGMSGGLRTSILEDVPRCYSCANILSDIESCNGTDDGKHHQSRGARVREPGGLGFLYPRFDQTIVLTRDIVPSIEMRILVKRSSLQCTAVSFVRHVGTITPCRTVPQRTGMISVVARAGSTLSGHSPGV
jgi:hypothetical protein